MSVFTGPIHFGVPVCICCDVLALLNDFLIEIHALGQCALEDIFVEPVDAFVLLRINVQWREADAVVADFAVVLGIGTACHGVRTDVDFGVNLCGNYFD